MRIDTLVQAGCQYERIRTEGGMEHRTRRANHELERGREVLRITWIGIWVNLALGVLKISAGLFGNSRAVLADGIHSLTDLISDFAIIIGVRYWTNPPDARHPYGHKKVESLVSFFIGSLLAAAGIGIIVDALIRMGQAHEARLGGLLALSAAVLSIISKEALYRWTLAKGRFLKSEAVMANAWDHRSDAFSSIPTAVAVAVAFWFPALAVVDLFGAVVVALFILHTAWKICYRAVYVLVDGGPDEEVIELIREYSLRVPGVKDVHELRTRYIGQGLQVDMHVSIDASLSVREGDVIAHRLEDALQGSEAAKQIGAEIFDVLVHIDPWSPTTE